MKRLLLIIMAATCAAVLTANAEERTKTCKFGDIESVRAGYTYKVYVTKGSSKEVKVVYDSELEKYMKVGYSDIQSMLTLQMEELPRKLQKGEIVPVEVYIKMDDIKGINLSGAAAIYFEGEYKTNDLEIELSGASNLHDLRISGHEASIECSGASKIDIEGSVESVRLEGSGACSIDAKDFIADNVSIDLSGSCKARVNAGKELRYDVARSCKMTYYGDAKLINTSEESNIIKGSF